MVGPIFRFLTQTRTHALVLLLYIGLFACWFSPILASGKYLAPGDGPIEYVPNYLAHRTLWEPALGTGYPAAADPLTFTWYLPAVLLSLIPGSFNAFVITGYVLAAWFTYLLAFTLTQSRLAGWIGGILYGFSGFLMAHVGHPSIVHSAAWIPAILLGLERIRGERSWGWFAFGCFATAQLLLSGHPQIFCYGLSLVLAYAAARGYSTISPRSYWLRAALMLGFGIGLSSPLLIPLIEFSKLSVRHDMTFEFFNSLRFPLHTLPVLFFPSLYGGELESIYGARYDEVATGQEAFLGFLTLALATYAFARKKQTAPVYFLLGAALLSLLFSFGGDTAAGRLLFHIAPFNMFRGQGRVLIVFQLAMAMLAAIGVKTLLSGIPAKRGALQLGLLLVLELAAALTISQVEGPALQQLATSHDVPNVSFALTRPMFLLPLACAVAAALAILWLLRRRAGAVSVAVLTLVALADMGQFGLFGSWRYYSPSRSNLDPPATAALGRRSNGRTVAVRGFLGNAAELPPNTSKLWGVDSLNRYGSLAVERYHSLAGMDTGGTLTGAWWDARNRALDVLAARWFLTPDADIGALDRFRGIPMPFEDLAENLGESGGRSTEASFAVDNTKFFTTLALVSFLRDSEQIGSGTPVLQLRLRGESGPDTVIPVLASQDTANCSAARDGMKPVIFKMAGATGAGGNCDGNFYFAQWPLPPSGHWSKLEAKWLAPQGGIEIAKLVLWNHDTGAIQIISHADALGSRFLLVAREQFTRVYENRQAMPRAWLTSQVLGLDAEAVKHAIQTSILPDGSTFNPWTTALVEEPVDLPPQAPDPGRSAVVMRAENTLVEVRTKSRQPSLAILADLCYPGWTATVNGRAARILRANFVQRGVLVPTGDNLVRFTYHPESLYLGIGIALASILGIALTCGGKSNKTPRERGTKLPSDV